MSCSFSYGLEKFNGEYLLMDFESHKGPGTRMHTGAEGLSYSRQELIVVT